MISLAKKYAHDGTLSRKLRRTPTVPLSDRQEDHLITITRTEFSVHFKEVDPELAKQTGN